MSSEQQEPLLLNFSNLVDLLISTDFSEFKSGFNDYIQKYDMRELDTVEDNLKRIKETCQRIHTNLDALNLLRSAEERKKLEAQIQTSIDSALDLKFIRIEGKTATYIPNYDNFCNCLSRIVKAFDGLNNNLPETFSKIKEIISCLIILNNL